MTGGTPLSGTPIALRAGGYAAEVASVGASLRTLRHEGRDLVVPFAEDEVRPLYRGAVLVPWPNRVVDGRYRFDGEDQQLPLTEPDRGHALHGLLIWADFKVVAQDEDESFVTLEADVVPQAGYPFALRSTVTYTLDERGLTTRISTVNTGPRRAPYGVSAHPYLVGGPGRVDDWDFVLAAERVLEVDADRLIPKGLADVVGTDLDFTAGRRIGDLFVDHAFTGVKVSGGTAEAVLTGPDGRGVRLTWDPAAAPWVQVHTGDRPEPEHHRRGLALEPMTCPPDAFNSGTDLIVLEPGASHTFSTTITAI